MDITEHAGLLLVNARRWPRTSNGQPRLLTALRAWLQARVDREDSDSGREAIVEWL